MKVNLDSTIVEKLEIIFKKTFPNLFDRLLRPIEEMEILQKNGIQFVDMMYNYCSFSDGFVPVDLGGEYYALVPAELAIKALTLGHLSL